MRNFLFNLAEKVFRKPRYRPDIVWDKRIWIANIFRLQEYLLGREFGIRAESSSSLEEKNGIVYVRYELYSPEAHVVHLEVLIRTYFNLLRTFLVNTFTFKPLPRLDYRPVYATFGILGFVFTLHTSVRFLPLFGLAIALDATSQGTATSTSPISWNHTCTGSNLILIGGFIVGSGGSSTLSIPTYNSVNMTIAGSQRLNLNRLAGLYYLLGPATGFNSVSAAFGGTFAAAHAGVVSWSGVAQSGQPDAVNGNTGTTANPDMAVTTVADNSWAVGVIANNNNTVTAGLTSRQALNTAGSFPAKGNLQDANGPKTPAGSQSVNWTEGVGIVWAAQAASFAPAATTTLIINVSDSITVAENITAASGPLFINVFDSVTATDGGGAGPGPTVQEVYNVSIFDSITVSESTTPQLVNMPSVFDSITVNESTVSSIPLGQASVFDSINVSESITLQKINNVSVFDSITVSEFTDASIPLALSVFDSITVAEATTPQEVLTISVVDNVIVSETVTVQENSFNVNLSDNITVAESVISQKVNTNSVFDSINVSESTTPQLVNTVNVFDSVTVSESIISQKVNLPNVFDSVTVAEVITPSKVLNVNVFDSVNVSESVITQTPIVFVNVVDNITVSESVSPLLITPDAINVADDVVVSESVSVSISTLLISVFDSILVSENITSSSSGIITTSQLRHLPFRLSHIGRMFR